MGYKTYTCPIAKDCGGCEWLAVPYEIQLQRKQEAMEELFAGMECPVSPIKGMDEPSRYRAKVMAPFKRAADGSIAYGMYRRGTHEIIQAGECLVEFPQAQPILATIARLARRFRIEPYNEDTGKGLLRHAVLRMAAATDDVMVTLVINRKEFPRKRDFVLALRDEHPEIATVVFNINTRMTNAVLGPQDSAAFGQGWIEDELCGCTFRIPSSAFYQTNPAQTEVLYSTAVQLAGLKGGEAVLDAYCGIGTIGIVAAHMVRSGKGAPVHKKKAKKAKAAPQQPSHLKLIGVESVPAAVEIASENARLNHVKGAVFHCGDAGEFMQGLDASLDVVFMDPPRAGASQEFVDALLAALPKTVVYISCNPQTQKRDIEALSAAYRVEKIVPVDMFPHTKHVETVALLTRNA